jgi:hypothetical protein
MAAGRASSTRRTAEDGEVDVGVAVGVAVDVAVAVTVGVGVDVAVDVTVEVGDDVAVEVAVGGGMRVAVDVGVGAALAPSSSPPHAVNVERRQIAKTRRGNRFAKLDR